MSDGEAFDIPVGFADDVSFVVPIVHFNHDSLDSPEDYIREAIANKKPIMPIIAKMVAAVSASERASAINRVLGEILGAHTNAGSVAWAIAFASGEALGMGKSIPEVAKVLGVEKQAFGQLVQRMSDRLSLPLTAWARSEVARSQMADSYQKRASNPIKAICKTKPNEPPTNINSKRKGNKSRASL